MTIRRGEIWWADLGFPNGSEAGFRRPVLVMQADSFNQSRIKTVICIALTSNLRLEEAPGNWLITKEESSLPKDSVANVSQIITIDKDMLQERVGRLSEPTLHSIEAGINLVLDLSPYMPR